MLRLVIRIIAAIAVLAVILFPALAGLSGSDGGSGGSDPVTIRNFDSKITVNKDGELTAVETITADFPAGRHGIFRYWDLSDAQNSKVRYTPKDIEITLNGHDVPVDMQWEQGRKIRVAKIGDPDRTLRPGEHTYTISYRVDGVISPEGDGSRFEWQTLAAGWSMRIDDASFAITLPHEPTETHCRRGSGQECDDITVAGNTVMITAKDLAANTPIRLASVFAEEAPAQQTVPWSIGLDPVLGKSVILVAIAGLLTAAGAAIGHIMERRTREETPGLPVMYEPPKGLGPVQTYYVTHESGGKNPLAATMMHLAEQGVVKLDQNGHKNWTITSLQGPEGWHGVDRIANTFGTSLGITTQGASFDTDGSVSAGEKLQKANSAITSATSEWGRQSGLVVTAVREWWYRIFVALAFVVAGIVVFILPAPSMWAAPFAALVVGGIGVFATGVGTRRTPEGREIWSRSGGFERFLSTPSAEDRFIFAERQNLYTDYIPYAVAFGVASQWAQRYQTAMGTEPPAPSWLPIYAGHSTSHAIASSISSFDSALSSSISAYQATQSSSSGGGGGGFSGGGGGGGGGGSW